MSTPTTSTLNADKNMNQSGNGTPVSEAVKLAAKLGPGNASLNNDHITPVGAQVNVGAIKPVDRRTIEGSYNGQTVGFDKVPDTVVLPANPGPREPRGQSQVFSSKLQQGSAPQAVTGESEASNN